MDLVEWAGGVEIHGTPLKVAITQGVQRELTLTRSTAYGRPRPEQVDGLNDFEYTSGLPTLILRILGRIGDVSIQKGEDRLGGDVLFDAGR